MGDQLDNNQLILRELYNTSHNDDKDGFLAAYEKFVNDSEYTGYFDDCTLNFVRFRPSSWREITYEYCFCNTKWIQVNSWQSRKACNCFNGKRYFVYRIAVYFSIANKQIVQDIIRNSGPINVAYKRWEYISDLQK